MAGWVAGAAVVMLAGSVLAPGSLDPSWGGDGTVVTDLGTTSGSDVVVLPDARVVVAGGDSHLGAVVVRYQPNGRLDRTFSGDGVAAHRFGDAASRFYDVAAAGDGSLVAAGTVERRDVPGGTHLVVARHRPDGSLDPAFGGGDGWVFTTWPYYGATTGLALHGDGSVVVAVSTFSAGTSALLRFTAAGDLDPSFGDGGVAALPLSSARDVVALPDGRSVVAGQMSGRAALAAVLADGSPDAAFGEAGVVSLNPTGWGAALSTVALAGDRLVAAGTAALGTGNQDDILVVRVDLGGRLDPSFGGGGFVREPLGSGFDDAAVDVGVQGDGRVVVTANDDSPYGMSTVMLRFRPDGRLDRSFGGTGAVVVEMTDLYIDPATAADVGAGKAVVLAHSRPVLTARVLL